jgi:hypothetical protein
MGQQEENNSSDKLGWICIYRKMQDCWVWDDKPYSYGQAWVDLLLLVNHREKKVMFDGKLITVSKGQRITSIRQLADSWGWSRTKVTNFLNLLESDKMIERKSDNKKTLITVVNYEVYQYLGDTEKPQKSRRSDTEKPQESTNNNDNNDNNIKDTLVGEKEPRKNFIPPTEEEVESYCSERGNGITGQQFCNFYASKGWMVGKNKMKAWKAAVRTWENKRGFKYAEPKKTKPEEPPVDPYAGCEKYDPDDPNNRKRFESGMGVDNGYWVQRI